MSSSSPEWAVESGSKRHPRDAFAELMAPKRRRIDDDDDEPDIWGVVYRITLTGVPRDHPLFGIVYIGQAIRCNAKTALEAAEMRWKEEIWHSKKYDKQVGLLWALDEFGESAFHKEVVESKLAPRSELEAWADVREIELIAAHGGVLKDQSKRCWQTLNIQPGGQGASRRALTAMWKVLRPRLFARFQAEMEEYVKANDSSLVPADYVASNGYRLGRQLANFRQGNLRDDMPKKMAIETWAEALPKWAWDATKTVEFLEGYPERILPFRIRKLEEFKTEMEAYVKENHHSIVPRPHVTSTGYKLGSQLHCFRQGTFRDGMPDMAAIEAWAEALPKWAWNARESEEYREGISERILPFRIRKLEEFKTEMEAYVKENHHSLVPTKYVTPTGYKLGAQLSGFRNGRLRDGMPEQKAIEAWAEALPKWAWDATKTVEFLEGYADRNVPRRRLAFEKFKTEMEAYVKANHHSLVPFSYVASDGYNLGSQLNHFRQGRMRNGIPDQKAVEAWAEALPKWAWNVKKRKPPPVAPASPVASSSSETTVA